MLPFGSSRDLPNFTCVSRSLSRDLTVLLVVFAVNRRGVVPSCRRDIVFRLDPDEYLVHYDETYVPEFKSYLTLDLKSFQRM